MNKSKMVFKRINITLDTDVLKILKKMAKEEERPLSRQVAYVIRFYQKHQQH